MCIYLVFYWIKKNSCLLKKFNIKQIHLYTHINPFMHINSYIHIKTHINTYKHFYTYKHLYTYKNTFYFILFYLL